MRSETQRLPPTGSRLWMILAGLSVALCAATTFALWHLRSDAVDSQSRELGLLSLALSDDVDRGMREVELGLHAVQAELQDGRLRARDPQVGRALQTRAELMAAISELWLVDPIGRVIAGSDAASTPALAQFYPPLEQIARGAMAVSRPYVDAASGTPMVALAMGYTDAGARSAGATSGWILASMPAQAMLGAFSVASPADDARMAIFRSDGVRLAGSIVTAPRLDEAAVAKRLAMLKGTELRRFRDGSERLVALHSLPRFGLEVVLTRDLSVALVSWRQAARLTAAGVVLLLTIMAASVWLILRADRRRAAAQRALQAQSSRASKLESLGTMAGGVAHDFNNVLAAIIGYGEMAQESAPAGGALARHLDKSMQAALRGKSLVERILTFSSGGGRNSTVFELEPVVEEVLTLLAGSMPAGVTVERSLRATGARLRGDPTRAFEAVMNLCTNALQAMQGGGSMRLALQRVRVGEGRVLSHTKLAAGDYLALAVSDSGPGIGPDVMEHLFEPFFSTRGQQSGTGLGLAVVHGVMAECNGAIDVQSEPGRGASFTLYFPECSDAAGGAPPPARPVPSGSGQPLLVVDDDPSLVALAEEMLTGLGYHPIGYTDPGAALALLRRDPGQFAAVITDEMMPGLSGIRLTEAIKALAPHLPVLVVSGYGGAMLASRAMAAGAARVLVKPLSRTDLACALADILPTAP